MIGTFDTVRSERAAQGRPATFDFEPVRPTENFRAAERPRPAEDLAEDDEVSRLYADAMDELESGRADSAQRKFEQVVAREPEGHLAITARGYLADLYRKPGTGTRAAAQDKAASEQPKFMTTRSALGASDLVKETAVIAPDTLKPLQAPDLGVAVSPGVEEEFIVEAGDRVFFAAGSADLGQRARIVLASQARWLAGRSELTAVIEGHADDGALPDEQSRQLSEARAVAVRDRLIEEGVPAARLFVAGAGRSQPIADCAGSDCAAQNRRVVTVLKEQVRAGQRRAKPRSLANRARLPTQ